MPNDKQKIRDFIFVQSFKLKIKMNGMEFKNENKENCSKFVNVWLFGEWVFVINRTQWILSLPQQWTKEEILYDCWYLLMYSNTCL